MRIYGFFLDGIISLFGINEFPGNLYSKIFYKKKFKMKFANNFRHFTKKRAQKPSHGRKISLPTFCI